MFDSYKKQALAAYEKRDTEGALSPRLKTPTPAGLRDECYDVYEEKGRPKEDATLRLFFGPIEQGNDYSQRIRNFDIDKFRPLVTFLNDNKVNTREKNTRLLIWLLDVERKPTFPDQESSPQDPQIPVIVLNHQDINGNELKQDIRKREEPELEPFHEEFVSVDNDVEYGGMVIVNPKNEKQLQPEEENNIVDILKPENENNHETTGGDGKGEDKFETSQREGKDKRDIEGDKISGVGDSQVGKGTKPSISTLFKITISLIILFVLGLAYWFWKNNDNKTIHQPLPTEQCMYWTGQHYEPINCNDNDPNKLKLPLNQGRLNHQQRITEPDTLTSLAIGKVWYGKTNWKEAGIPQFYTDSGVNPLDTNKRLLPVTTYMLNKYTSYHRYLLHVIAWRVSLSILFILLVILAYKSRKPQAGKIG